MLEKIDSRRRRLMARLASASRDGFSLVEIMMVMVILTVGVLPLAVIHHQARREVVELVCRAEHHPPARRRVSVERGGGRPGCAVRRHQPDARPGAGADLGPSRFKGYIGWVVAERRKLTS